MNAVTARIVAGASFVLAVSLALAACSDPPIPSTEEVPTVPITRLYSDWKHALEEQDLDRLEQLVTEDAVFWAGSAPEIRGPSSVRAAFEGVLGAYDIRQEWTSEELILAGDWAFDRGVETTRVTPRDGTTPPPPVARRAMMVLHRGADGGWRFARSLSTAAPPPEEADAAGA